MKSYFLLAGLAIVGFANASVVNGDFEAGNTGFTTDLTYSPTNYYPEGIYSVDTNPNTYHGSFTSFGDHTSGSGKMLIVNGSTDSNKKLVWEGTTSNLAAGTYTLSFWMANAYDSNNVILNAKVDGNLVGTGYTVVSGTGTWNQFSTTFTTTGGVSTLSLINDQLAYGGNDFAIDDISVEAVPEPMTMAFLGIGAAAMLRRRRK